MVEENERQLLFDKALRNIDFTFHYCGLKVNSRERPKYYSLRCRCLYVFNLLWLNTDVLGAIVWFINGIQLGKTFTELTSIAPCIAFTFLGNFKFNYLVYYEKNIDKLVELLRAVEMSVTERGDGYKKVDHVMNEINFLNKVVYVLNIFNVCSIVMFAFSPFIIIWLNYYQTGEYELVLPFLILYPFDPFTFKTYPFVYLHQFWSECVVVLFISSADYLFYTCCIFIRMNFQLLKTWIEELIANQKLSEGRFKENEDFRRRFKEVIRLHQLLIRVQRITSAYVRPLLDTSLPHTMPINPIMLGVFAIITTLGRRIGDRSISVDNNQKEAAALPLIFPITCAVSPCFVPNFMILDQREVPYRFWFLSTIVNICRSVLVLEHVYAKSTLFHCVLSSIIICLCGFNMTENGEFSIVFTFTVFLILGLMQTYCLCFFGDMIMSSSEELSQAIYNCYWYLAESKITKSLFIVQIRTQKPCKLTAYGYAHINLTSFMRILSTSWSYFALLKTVYSSSR